MSLAKFCEDNFEIVQDRIYMNTEETPTAVVSVSVSYTNSQPCRTKNPVLLVRNCKCCGNTFSLRKRTVLWYLDRHMNLPKRCPTCLQKKNHI